MDRAGRSRCRSSSGDVLRAIAAPGWIVSATQADGIVRVVNHGTDHAVPSGAIVGDSPLYARLGYSTATSPLLDERAGPSRSTSPSCSSTPRAAPPTAPACALLGAVQTTERMRRHRRLDVRRALGRRPTPARRPRRGRTGEPIAAGRSPSHSLVRGPWELRLSPCRRARPGSRQPALRLRVGGWAVAGAMSRGDRCRRATRPRTVATGRPAASARSRWRDARGSVIERRDDASPLGASAAVPWLEHPVHVGDWVATLVELAGAATSATHPQPPAVDDRTHDSRPSTGPTASRPSTRLTTTGSPHAAARNQ